MNKFIISAACAAIIATMSGGASAQSAKFAASWDTDEVATLAATSACVDSACSGQDETTEAEVEMAQIHIGASKSVLISVSSEVGIYMMTTAKGGKNNSDGDFSSSAMGEGNVDVTLSLIDQASGDECSIAPNSTITLKNEMRKLTVSGGGTFADTDDEFWIEVGIETNSAGAHHFEFIGVECGQGTYDLTATFDLTAIAEALGVSSSAEVVVTLGDRLVSMQEVRAVKGSLVSDGD